jgi:hypothetical protein
MNELFYDASPTYLRQLGRFYLDEQRKARMLTFSASGFEVRFKGTSLFGEWIATECGNPQGEGALAIVVDETPFKDAKKIVLNQPCGDYVLAEGLPYGEHVVRVYKRTESSCSKTGWICLKSDGEFLPILPKKRFRIEVYGDSITAGNGVEGVVGDDLFETRTENALLSYAALASEALDMDFSLIAVGGFAAYKSPWNKEAKIQSIPEMFSFADYAWSTDEAHAIPWDNSSFTPDLTIISLGTNDDEYLLPLPKEEREKESLLFQKKIKDFIDRCFRAYPHTKVIVAIGMIPVVLVPSLLQEVVALYPANLYYLAFDSLKVGGYMANGGHPNQAMHEEASKELYAFIKDKKILDF